MRWFLALVLVLLPLTTSGEEVVLGLSQDRVAITTSFDGSEILIFGAVKRETKIPDGPPLQVVITVAGPSGPVVVRRKENRFGIWVNTDAVELDAAPSFYAVATTAPLSQILSDTEDLRHKISINRAIRFVGAPQDIPDTALFTDAVIRIRQAAGLYQVLDNNVALDQQTLFRTSIEMPANLTEGDYSTRIFLTRDGQVVSHYETVINVEKAGLERFLFTLSRQQPLLYGLMSLAIAIIAGWGASAAFTLLRNQ
ncbi:MAG: TIGR02186 family protein [Rhodobacteraceae bacterium]|nr:TIGR02186 family protein [Paracoccaceae bacterium]